MKEIVTTESILGKQVSYWGKEYRFHYYMQKEWKKIFTLNTRSQQDTRQRIKKEKKLFIVDNILNKQVIYIWFPNADLRT